MDGYTYTSASLNFSSTSMDEEVLLLCYSPLQPQYPPAFYLGIGEISTQSEQQSSKASSIPHSFITLLRWTIRRRPGIIILRQHKLLHMSASDFDISANENKQYHSRVQQVPKWLIRVVCASRILYQQISRNTGEY